MPLITPSRYKPSHLEPHPKPLTKLYKPRAYKRDFTVSPRPWASISLKNELLAGSVSLKRLFTEVKVNTHYYSLTLRGIIALVYVDRVSRVDEDHLVIQGSERSSGVGEQVAG